MDKQKWLNWAEVLDSYRIVPRLLLCGYAYLVYKVVLWYMGVPVPSVEHAALVTAVVGIIAPVAGMYFNSGRKWGDKE